MRDESTSEEEDSGARPGMIVDGLPSAVLPHEVEPALTASERRFVERLVAALGDHGCFRRASVEKRAALLRYAGRAVRFGTPFDDETLDGLTGLGPTQVDEAAADISEKTSPGAREALTASSVPDSERTWIYETLDRVFGNADTVIEPFLPDAPDLWSHIDAATAAHNVSVDAGTAEGRYAPWKMRRHPGGSLRMCLEQTTPGTAEIRARSEMSMHEALAGIRRWDLAEDLQMSSIDRAPAWPREKSYEQRMASRQPARLDKVDPGALKLVHSRSPRLFAEASTGQRWTSCLKEEDKHFNDVVAYCRRGGVISYLVDQDDERARYPFLRVILVPGGEGMGSLTGGPDSNRYKLLDIQGRGYGMEATAVRFREAAFTLARRLNREASKPSRSLSERPGGDAYQLTRIVDRVIDAHRPKSQSIQQQVTLARDLNEAWKGEAKKVLVADVALAWTQYRAAIGAVDRLAARRQGWKVAQLIDGLRERAFERAPGVVAHRRDNAHDAVCEAFEEALADQDPAAVPLPPDEREALINALAAPPRRGDVVAAALRKRVSGSGPPAPAPFDLANTIWQEVEQVQIERWKHLQKAAQVVLSLRKDAHERAAEAERELAKNSAASDMDRAFEAWRDLTYKVSSSFGKDAWRRVRTAVLRDGLERTLKRLCLPYMWPLTADAALSLVFCSAGAERRQRVREQAAKAVRDVPHAWEAARQHFEASPWSRGLQDPYGILLELFGTHGGNSPHVKLGDALGDLWREHDKHYILHSANEERLRQRSFLTKILLPDECKTLKRTKEAALEEYHRSHQCVEDPRIMPGWVGATRADVLAYCWLSDVDRFRKKRTLAVREAHNRLDEEEVAWRAHRLIRFEEIMDIPDPARLVTVSAERLKAKFPDFWKAPWPRRVRHRTDLLQPPKLGGVESPTT